MNMVEEYESTPEGAREMAAARLDTQVSAIIDRAYFSSKLPDETIALRLGVEESRLDELLNGDGNLRVASIAKLLHVLGYKLELKAVNISSGEDLPEPIRRKRSESSKRPE